MHTLNVQSKYHQTHTLYLNQASQLHVKLVYITCPVFISTLIISVKRDLPCFVECCCGPGGVYHHACEGWSSAFCGALICNEDETADDHTLSNTPSTSVGCTLAPEDLEDRPPTSYNCSHWRLPKQREHANISWSRLVCSDCVWQALVCC